MAAGGGISGTALALAVAGGYLLYAGIQDVPLVPGLVDLAHGRKPAGRAPKTTATAFTTASPSAAGADGPSTGSPSAPGALGARIVAGARKQLGKPYRWGAAGPDAFDCSGLVVWVLNHEGGLSVRRMVTQQFLVWRGARTVPWSQQAPGDLACWSGHMGICIGGGRMIHAPRPGLKVMTDKIWRTPEPLIRRVSAPAGT